MREDLRDWSRELTAVLRDKRISNNAAAQAVGVSPATFTSWVSGATRPSVEALPAISELTGLAVWYLHELAGYLPASYTPATAVIQATKSQRDLYVAMQHWAQQSLDAIGLSPAAHAAGLILEHDPTWQVTLRPYLKGVEHSLASHTLIGLKRSRGPNRSLHRTRDELEQSLGPSLTTLGVRWRNRAVPGWDEIPDLLLEVPETERSRAPGLSRLVGLPPSIAVLGVPYAHAELVGALLAEAVDYGYVNLHTESCVRYELGLGPSRAELADSAAQLTKAILTQPTTIPPRSIWACASPEAVDDTFADLMQRQAHQTHVLYVRAEENLVRFGSEVWGYHPEECLAMADRLDTLSRNLGKDRCTVIEVQDVEVFAHEPQDGVTDEAVRVALLMLEELKVADDDRLGYVGSLKPR